MDKGAHFFRCDFQVHTPRDTNWSGDRPVTPEARQAWADAFVATCRAKNLGAVAITDHHDFAMVPFVRKAASSEKDADGKVIPKERQLVVFPGLELTLSVPCQALLILDAAFPDSKLDTVLTRLAVPVFDPAEERLIEVTPIDIPLLSALHAELDKEPLLRDRYIVLPNVTDKGHKTLLRSGMHHKYREMPCVGGYLDGTVETKVGAGNHAILAGQNAQYGNKRVALFQTSDSRSDTYNDLGKHTTWVKWAVPTAEALRQACLAQESRISHTEPELPTTWLSRMSVDNSMFLGPIELELNSQFNAIIGGRGTGKSTILDYLRWALCDMPAGGEDDEEIGDPAARRRRLINATLAPTSSTVEVHFSINDISHVVRRNATSGDLTLKVGAGEFVAARESDVRELLPVQAYSQKQLSSVSVRIDELTRFVTAPIRRELATIDQQIEEAAGRIRENYASLQRFRQLTAAIRRLELSAASLAEQANNLRDSLEDVSDTDRSTLDDKPKFDAAITRAEGWERAITRALQGATRLESALSDIIFSIEPAGDAPDVLAQPLNELETRTTALLEDLRDSVAAAATRLRDATSGKDYTELVDLVKNRAAMFDESYESVKTRSSAHTAKLAELATVEQQVQAAARTLNEQRAELEALGRPEDDHIALMRQRFDLMGERSDILAAQCETLAELSGGLLRATLDRGQGLAEVGERFRGVVAGSGMRGSKIDDFFEQLAREASPLATWATVIDELEALTTLEPETSITTEPYPTLARLGFAVADLKRVAGRLSADGWLTLALTPVSDHPRFSYETKEDEFIDFALASAGQQATALLRVLLAQPGPPLIIDQPEDDLDSEVVQHVVEKMWDAKRHRQLIFSSHNANLVVNGDAELVIHCDYRVRGEQSRGEIKGQGAIDLPEIRSAITQVMEGGEKAFKLRAEKYGF